MKLRRRRPFLRLALALRRVARTARFTTRRWLHLSRPVRVLPFRGYASGQQARLRARVLEDRGAAPLSEHASRWRHVVAAFRRFSTREVPCTRVQLTWGERKWEAVTDEEGHLDVAVPTPEGLQPGWHLAEMRLGQDDVPALAPVLLASPRAEYGVVSDLDDTVIITGVAHIVRRLWSLFLADAKSRLPFEGVSAFYQALHGGRSGEAGNPIVYVSSSPWNLYEHLDEFLRLNGIPAGPLLLRDWGLSPMGFAPWGGHAHKLDKIREVLGTLAPLPFLLIGDSGQEDPEHYLTIAREFPGRIPAVYIRTVHEAPWRTAELERLAEEVREAGSELVLVKDTVSAARHAARRGFIRPDAVPEVREARDEEQDSPRLSGLTPLPL
jgi:phosphatidate phosphatase APP1